jgi:hypothetical protein
VRSEGSQNGAAACVPCADSALTIEEQIAKLDNMELVQGNESDFEKPDNEESVA